MPYAIPDAYGMRTCCRERMNARASLELTARSVPALKPMTCSTSYQNTTGLPHGAALFVCLRRLTSRYVWQVTEERSSPLPLAQQPGGPLRREAGLDSPWSGGEGDEE